MEIKIMKKLFLILGLLSAGQLFAFECKMPDQTAPDCSIAGEDDYPPYGPALKKRCTGTWW